MYGKYISRYPLSEYYLFPIHKYEMDLGKYWEGIGGSRAMEGWGRP